MIKSDIIKSNAMFWREFFNQDKIESINIELQDVENELQEKNIDLVCVFDNDFPNINLNLKNSEKPFLLAYKGNIDA